VGRLSPAERDKLRSVLVEMGKLDPQGRPTGVPGGTR
jgi:hypothetical protein